MNPADSMPGSVNRCTCPEMPGFSLINPSSGIPLIPAAAFPVHLGSRAGLLAVANRPTSCAESPTNAQPSGKNITHEQAIKAFAILHVLADQRAAIRSHCRRDDQAVPERDGVAGT